MHLRAEMMLSGAQETWAKSMCRLQHLLVETTEIPLKAQYLQQKQSRNSSERKIREKVLYFTSVLPY